MSEAEDESRPTGASVPDPPEPPSIRRRLLIPREHLIGQMAILAIVLLALGGAFGDARGTARADTAALSTSVEYPWLIRYKTLARLEITIRAGGEPVEDLHIAVSSDYLDAFSNVDFLPQVERATAQSTLIPVGDLIAHEERVVSGEVQAERYWLHEGWLEVRDADGTVARVALSTVVYP